MRILSQEGLHEGIIDVQYEQVSIEQKENEIWCGYSSAMGRHCVGKCFSKYSTEAKARKAMEMLREQYARLCSLSTYLHGGMELFAKTISQKEAESFSVEYLNMNIFQFPADDEVEV